MLVGYFYETYALKVYRKGQSSGSTLIRTIPLSELWPKDQLPKMVSTDGQQWYSRGMFSFSQDDTALIYHNGWGEIHSVDLASGKVD